MELNTFLTFFVPVFSALAVMFFAVSFAFYIQKRQLKRLIRMYFEQPDIDTPSEFAKTVDTVGQVIAARLVSQIKSTVMGMNSVDSKNATRQAAAEVMQGNPSLAGLAGILPKRWAKSPEILSLAASLLGKINAPSGDNGSSDTSDIISPYQNT